MNHSFDHFLAFVRSLVHEHGDATTGALLGLLGGLGAHEQAFPALADLPTWARIALPLVAPLVPVLGKFLLSLVRPTSKGVVAGMRTKARLLRERAAELCKAGDEKSADLLRDRADNLESEAAVIEAAESDDPK